MTKCCILCNSPRDLLSPSRPTLWLNCDRCVKHSAAQSRLKADSNLREGMKRSLQVGDSLEKPRKQQRLGMNTGDDAVGLTEALDFTALNSLQEISGRFDELAKLLMFGHLIHLRTPGSPSEDIEYEILELEFYLHKPGCHADPFTHRSTEQKRSGRWSVYLPCLIPKPSQASLNAGISIEHPRPRACLPRVIEGVVERAWT